MTEAKPHVVIVGNGDYPYPQRALRCVDAADLVVAADGGANWLAAHGRRADVLVGDMDSVVEEVRQAFERAGCRLVWYRPDKDETDMELALLEAARLGAGRITVLGALGGRIDHTLANILLLTLPQLREIPVVIDDGASYLSLVRAHGVIRGRAGDTVSLLPLGGDAEGVATEGLRYPLCDETLYHGPARGISNVLLGAVGAVRVRCGMLLLIHTPQERIEEDG